MKKIFGKEFFSKFSFVVKLRNCRELKVFKENSKHYHEPR